MKRLLFITCFAIALVFARNTICFAAETRVISIPENIQKLKPATTLPPSYVSIKAEHNMNSSDECMLNFFRIDEFLFVLSSAQQKIYKGNWYQCSIISESNDNWFDLRSSFKETRKFLCYDNWETNKFISTAEDDYVYKFDLNWKLVEKVKIPTNIPNATKMFKMTLKGLKFYEKGPRFHKWYDRKGDEYKITLINNNRFELIMDDKIYLIVSDKIEYINAEIIDRLKDSSILIRLDTMQGKFRIMHFLIIKPNGEFRIYNSEAPSEPGFPTVSSILYYPPDDLMITCGTCILKYEYQCYPYVFTLSEEKYR